MQFGETYKNFWVGGVMDNELLVLRLPDHVDQPPIMRAKTYKRIPFQIPLLDLKTTEVEEDKSKEAKENFAGFEEQILRNQFILSHEVYRKQKWELLKTIRTEADNERHQSQSILELQEITNKKKELDKIVMQSIRLAILNNEPDKVFQYLDLINFT